MSRTSAPIGMIAPLAVLVILAPVAALLGVALLVAPAATAGCTAPAASPLADVASATSAAEQGGGALALPSPAVTGSIATGCPGAGELAAPPLPPSGVQGVVADPTGTGGFVTTATAHLIAQTQATFPGAGWACWSPRPGTTSEHPLGRACDVTFGNAIGVFPTAEQAVAGWQMTTWLQVHAETLDVAYLIWQGQIWSLARATQGWRPYDGGGIHDPTSPTGGHYDHLHITVSA